MAPRRACRCGLLLPVAQHCDACITTQLPPPGGGPAPDSPPARRPPVPAGEEGGPENIWSAVRDLGVERIDHGTRCLEDPQLVAALEAAGPPLTLCPLSNLRLQVWQGWGAAAPGGQCPKAQLTRPLPPPPRNPSVVPHPGLFWLLRAEAAPATAGHAGAGDGQLR